MSGGQQQRVSIARALAKKSEVILADEPTGSLDYETGRLVLKTLLSIVREKGKTLILVTHAQEIGKLADRVITLKNGRIISEVFNDSPLSVDDIQW